MPRSVVTDPELRDWGDDRPPRTPAEDTILHEAHVRASLDRLATTRIPAGLRGSYAAAGHPAVIEHLLRLGVTAVELLPVHQYVSEPELARRGLANYWGYNSISFLAPHNGYCSAGQRGEQVREFKAMVRALHQAGLEVILDVVYNHTAEGGPLGPTLSFRGIDNAAYYRLRDDDLRRYVDDTGCGNSLNVRHPHALQLIMDSLRYWVLDMHVDGFRFDLAPATDQERGGGPLRGVPAHGRPGSGGVPGEADRRAVGQPAPAATSWAASRRRGRNGTGSTGTRSGTTGAASPGRCPGSPPGWPGRARRSRPAGAGPPASINYVTCHDGFTLQDLVSYERKHNEANGEGGRDGSDDNISWNCGAEGRTGDPAISRLRARQKRNFLVSLLCSQGMPMLAAGDEFGRSQAGNNNAYCQDNEISWLDWELSPDEQELLEFARAVTGLRRTHRVFRRRTFFRGRPAGAAPGNPADVVWFTPSGQEMSEPDWHAPGSGCLAVFLDGGAWRGPRGRGSG